jgi:hypothetical protein
MTPFSITWQAAILHFYQLFRHDPKHGPVQ